jgi:diacylglycerol kinase (ATP)
MEKTLFVYNPLSGSRNIAGKLDYIIGRFMDKQILAVPFRLGNDGQDRLSAVLDEDAYSSVIVSGGDGTVNTVANAVLKSRRKLPLGIIPSGTCNDFARSLNIPSDLRRCMDIILAGRTTEIDAGLMNGRTYFLNTCAGGNFVDVSYSTSSELKRNIGPLAYYMKALGEMTNLKPVALKITTDSETIEQEFLFFLILNGRHAAGFKNIIQKADLSDGYMDILLLNSCPPIDLAGLFFKGPSNEFLNDRNVIWIRTKNCTIEGSKDFSISVDGEKWETLPITVNFINKILMVYVK